MSKSDWRALVSSVGAGLIVLVLVGWSALANLQTQQRQVAQRQEEAQREERRAIETLLLDPREQAITSETRARRQAEREHSDLDAQWATAMWTFAQAFVGALGLAGLFFTVFYASKAAEHSEIAAGHAKTELDEARDEAKRQAHRFDQQLGVAREQLAEARVIGRQQVRAYLSVTEATITFASVRVDEVIAPTCKIEVLVKNAGQSPARSVRCVGTVRWKGGASPEGSATRAARADPISANSTEMVRIWVPCPQIVETPDKASFDVDDVDVRIEVTAIDVFDEPIDSFSVDFWYKHSVFSPGKSLKDEIKYHRRNSMIEPKNA